MSYSDVVREHFFHPRNVGEIADADGVGVEGRPGQGQHMVISVRLERERIAEIAFKTFGCAASIASCSVLTEMVKGRTVREALAVSRDELAEALGGLPLGKEHCPGMALGALRKALLSAEGPGRHETTDEGGQQ